MKLNIECLLEPELAFGRGVRGVEPRRMLAIAGPPDIGPLREIHLGLVGPREDVLAVRQWLSRLGHFMPAKERNASRYRNWPGAERALGVRFVVEDRFVRPLDPTRLNFALNKCSSREGFEELLELFCSRIEGLFGDTSPDCILVCLPEDIAELRIENANLTYGERRALERLRAEEESNQLVLFQPSPEELKAAEDLRTQADDLLFRTFYRALKARVMSNVNPVPVQVVRRETVERPEGQGHSYATRAWNLAISIYYKSGGLPWRPADLPENICFVGISFHHLKKRSGSLVYASVAEAFSTEIEPFALKGETISYEQRRDCHPYLSPEQSFSLMQRILEQYEARAGVLPNRVVVHKTTMYQPEEQEGFEGATHSRVPACDLIWIRSTPFRLLRRGIEEPWRGTMCRIGPETYLFTSGYVPWWNEYPGPHIPAPIQIGSANKTDIRQRAKEILALTKMNWNSTEGVSRHPITLSFAKRVGQFMSELPDDVAPNPSYRFHM